MPTSIETTAADFRSLRRAARATLAEMAGRLHVPSTLLRQIERGLAEPDVVMLNAASKEFGVPINGLKMAHAALMRNVATGEGYVTARPESRHRVFRREQIPTGTLPILDLFCGTGGFSHGFEQTRAFSVCAGIDLLPDRIETFAANHGTAHAHCADIASLGVPQLLDDCPTPAVVIGGPPCQGFSSIRPFRNLNISDQRNNLFENFAIVIEACRPEWFVMENVVGLLTHGGDSTLQAILGLFDQIGYQTSWRVLNTAYYGLPQRRERFVLVGSRRGKVFRWPEPTHFLAEQRSMAGRHAQVVESNTLFSGPLLPATTVMDAIHDLPPLESGESASAYRNDIEPTAYERAIRNGATELTLHEATQHSAKMLRIIRHAGHNINALPPGLVTSGFSSCYSRLEPDLPAVTLTVNFVHPASNKCIHPHQNRALTPREGARVQGFPDTFQFVGSRAQIVKQIGNAVPPLLGRIIAEALLSSM